MIYSEIKSHKVHFLVSAWKNKTKKLFDKMINDSDRFHFKSSILLIKNVKKIEF